MATPNDPSVVRSDVQAMQQRASVCNTLMAGTLAMREAAQAYLPKEAAESAAAYESRLGKTVLFPAFRKAVATMTGKPFGTPIDLGADVPKPLKEAAENIDLAGRDLDTFARDVFQQDMPDGIGWVLVDYPRVAPGLSLEAERATGARPYFVHVPLSRVVGWRGEIVNGVHKLTQFRFQETVEVPDGDFGTKSVQRIRVWEPGLVRVYVKTEGSNGEVSWVLDEENSGSVTMDEVPVATFYTGRTGFMTAEPPLEDLAWLNVEHWQSRSDQRHILHFARVPMLFGKDLDKATDGKVVVGPNRLITGGPNSDLKVVEHTGAAIASGRVDLQDIESAMQRCAGEILSRTSGDKTATETDQEAREGSSQLRKWVFNFADSLEECFRLAAKWIRLDKGGSITINTNWDDAGLDAQMMQALTNAHQAGAMSLDTLVWNFKQAGILPPDTTVEQERAKIDNETTAGMATMGAPTSSSLPRSLKEPPPAQGGAGADGQDGQ